MANSCDAISGRLTIFGAGGFVGGVCASELEKAGRVPVQRVLSKDADFSREEEVAALGGRVGKGGAWLISAARTPERSEPAQQNMLINISIARNLAGLFAAFSPSYVIFLSSIDVYGRSGLQLPLNEKSPLRPESYYAVSKCASEWILSNACREHRIPLTILRLPGVYGPGDPHRGPVRSFIDAAVRNVPADIHGDGEQRRDLLYVRDVPRIVESLYAERVPGVFNAVTGCSVSLNRMLELVEKAAETRLEIRYHKESAQIDIAFEEPRLLRALPLLELTAIEEGIRETYFAERDAPRAASLP